MSVCVEDELEGIAAVLSEDYKLIQDTKDDQYTHCFEVYCFPCDDLDDCHCSVQLCIKVPKDYPNIIPSIQILSMDGISQNTANNLMKHLHNQLNKSLQQEVLYNIIDLTKEYLKQYNFIGADRDDMHTINPNDNNEQEGVPNLDANNEFGIDGEDDDDFNDDDDAGWDDIDESEDGKTFAKSLESIQKIMESEQKHSDKNSATKIKKSQIKYNVLTLQDVMDDDLSSTRLLAAADVCQLTMSNPHFYGELRVLDDPHAYGRDKYEIRIGIQLSKYIQTKTLLNVLGFLQDEEYMVIRLELDDNYVHNAKPPRVIEIGKSVPHKPSQPSKKNRDEGGQFQAIKLRNKLQAFVGSRSLMNRINNKLFARLWPPTHVAKHYPSKYKQIMQLVGITGHSYEECKMTLDQLRNYDNALVHLSQNTQGKDKPKHKSVITKHIHELCDALISYGLSEMLQKQNTKKIDKEEEQVEGKQDKEVKPEWDKHCIQYQLQPFLKDAAAYFMHNILAQITYFALYSTLTLSKRCLVCDIDFPSYSGLIKPTVCKNILCLYGHEELEIGLDIASMIKDSPEIIDLLITFCFVAAKKGRLGSSTGLMEVHGLPPNEHINLKKQWKESDNPYIYQQSKPREYNVLDSERLMKVLNKIPSIDTLLGYAKKGGNRTIKRSLGYKSPLLWPLLRWMVVTNRSHLVPLRTKQERFDGLPSCVQFKFVSYTPEREYRMQQLSKKNNDCGTIYAWHGSPMGNWHNILRNGLKNMSNTKHMRNGAAFGRGIYLAPDSGTSYWYCEPSRSDTWPLSMFNRSDWYGRGLTTNTAKNAKHTGHGLYTLALCEILNHPKLKPPEPYYVVPTESWVMIRYLFVFNTMDNKSRNHWTGKGRYFDIEANKLMKNYKLKQKQK
eukprot:1077784_1